MADGPAHTLIVGASSGIGRALAERLASRSAVSALARREERLAELAPLGVTPFRCDASDIGSISEAVTSAVDANGLITSMVFCAGLQKIKPLRMTKPAELAELLKVNLEAALVLGGLFTSKRVSVENAVFCAVSSIAATRPEPGIVAYAAAKAGLEAFVKGLAREAAPRRAVAVAPGWLDTEMTQAQGHIYNSAFREKLAQSSPLGIADVAAVVDCIEFLLSPAARYITGEIVRVDAGAAL